MDDGLGFSIGSIFGGFLFQTVGGRRSFQIFSCLAFITCIAHILLRPVSTHEIRTIPEKPTNVESVLKSNKNDEEETLEVK